jgi:hypothetical protein
MCEVDRRSCDVHKPDRSLCDNSPSFVRWSDAERPKGRQVSSAVMPRAAETDTWSREPAACGS